MKVSRKSPPVKYDLYGQRPCYHVTLFEEELCVLSRALHCLCDMRVFGLLISAWSETERRQFYEGLYELTFALDQIENGNTEHTGKVVRCDD